MSSVNRKTMTPKIPIMNVVANWMRLRNIIEYLGVWEQLNNQILKGSNSMLFYTKQMQTRLRYRRNVGLTLQMR
jgi:hypothetical protein